MTDRDRITERELEQLAELLPPGEGDQSRVTPWKQASYRVLWGLALVLLAVNHSPWNLLLPALGHILRIPGFRALRRESRAFGLCYALCWLQAGLFCYRAAAQCTIWQAELLPRWVPWLGVALEAPLLLGLWAGFRTVRKKAGLPPRDLPFAALILWYGLLLALALANVSGVPVILLLVGYIAVLANLFLVARQLQTAGYALNPAPKRLPDWVLSLLLVLALLVSMSAGYALGGKYPMDWSVQEQTQRTDAARRLLDLGLPADILADLRPEDIEACAGALEVVVQEDLRAAETGKEKTLCITGVAVKLQEEPQAWRIFHHFRWLEPPDVLGTEAIQVWPTTDEQQESWGWTRTSEYTGQVLYDDAQGNSFSAPYHHLGVEHYTSDSLFFGTQSGTDLFGAFSYPVGSENQRGYVSYSFAWTHNNYIIYTWLNYEHQTSLWHFPAQSALEVLKKGAVWFHHTPFRLVQDTLDFNPWDW